MGSLNKCMFIGRLGKDPEMSLTKSGTKVGKFSLAIDEKYKDKESTLWMNITTFDKLAEIASQYCRKGQQIYVEGRLSVRQYDRQDGTKGTWVELMANQIVLLGKAKDAVDQQQQPSYGGGSPEPSGQPDPDSITDGDLPF
jgi:single-strand DNA-binding protein